MYSKQQYDLPLEKMEMKKLIPSSSSSSSLQQLPLVIIVLFLSCTIASIIQLPLGGNTDPVILNVLDFGAVGDGIADDTAALRRTLHFASAVGGATILFPEYHAFNSGPLNLTSHITLQVDGTLQALDWTTTDWPQIPPLATYGNSRDGPYLQYQPFIYASHAFSIRIVGIGTIDGNGQPWWDAFQNDRSILKAGRPNLIQLIDCHQVEISGVTLIDSPFWCLHPVLCTDVHIHHIKIRSHMYAPNSDGIDPDSSRNVLIEYNDISCGDDHIAIKAGVCGKNSGSPLNCDKIKEFTDGTYETVNVTIRRNIFRIGMGISLGSECSGGIRNVLIEDNHVGVCLPGHCENGCCGWSPALHLKSTATRGGHMKDIVFRNNTIYNTTSVILLENNYQSHDQTNEDRPTLIQNLSFQSNRMMGSAKGMNFLCNKKLPCRNVTFFNNDFDPTKIGCENVKVLDQNGNDICPSTIDETI